jgi:uncharacterized protein
MNSSIDQQFVEFVVKSLVGNPDAVQIDRRIDEKGVLLELTVDPEDLGRVIGKRGATAQSLRTLLRALGTKNEARYNLKIIDNGVQATAATVVDDVSMQDDDVPSPMSNSDATATEDDQDDSQSTQVSEAERDRMARHRKDLEELDDLDI